MRAFLPGINYGGPVTSVAGIIDHLGEACEFRVVTLNHDFRSAKSYDLEPRVWLERHKHRAYYAFEEDFTFAFFKKLFDEWQPDFLYLQSVFCWRFTIMPILAWRMNGLYANQIVVAPRGMLSQGALSLKWWKKIAFLKVARAAGLFHGVRWHASTTHEEQEVRRSFGLDAIVTIAPNLRVLSSAVSSFGDFSRTSNIVRVIFFSRIHPKKGLLFAIRVLGMLPQMQNVLFDIAGPADDLEYESLCRQECQKLSTNVHVNWVGIIQPQNVVARLSSYDVLILPTFGENYGHVIVDAWLAGCPVLISDKTPWRDLESKKLGFDMSLEYPSAFMNAILRINRMDPMEREDWRGAARRFGEGIARDPKAVEKSLVLFHDRIVEVV